MTDFAWPPPYHIMRHPRAKQVKIRFCDQRGLLLTLPKRFSTKHLPEILEEFKPWIIKNYRVLPSLDEFVPPQAILLTAYPKVVKFSYLSFNKWMMIEKNNNEICVMGDLQNKALLRTKLVKWIKCQATQCLTDLFHEISSKIDLPFSSLMLRMQKTMWGSCSTQQQISLNYKLIFLNKALVQYVMIHELCHTIHHDHSKKFWQLVERFEPHYLFLKKELQQSNSVVPNWFY